jgi:hypothetical protein
VAQNLCCAIINYRLSPLEVPEGSEEHFKHPGHTEDCAYALSFLYSHASFYSYDINNVIIIGHSAGGFMSALLQFEDHFRHIWLQNENCLKVKRFIGLQGIYDLPTIMADFGEDYLKYMIAPAFGWDATFHKNTSPSKVVSDLSESADYSSKVSIPWTLIWSNKDTMVNQRQSEDFEAALKKNKIETTHLILQPDNPNEGSHHGITTKDGFTRFVLPIIMEILQQSFN